MTNPNQLTRRQSIQILIKGLIIGDAVGLLLCAVVFWICKASMPMRVPLGVPSPFLIPVVMGFVSAWVWRPLKMRTGPIIIYTIFSMMIALGGAFLLMGEGTICLVILSPLLYAAELAGAILCQRILRRSEARLHVFVLPALVAAVLGEPFTRGPHTGVVTDEIRIHAPPSKVWPHVLAFDPIPARPDYWLFHIGLPYPVRTTNTGNYAGADRACEFSGGAVFKEKIAELTPEHLLTFDIVEAPRDPELIGHLDAHRGQFELRDNHDGTTTLIGRTWYSLHVRPAFYFDWWTHDIFRAVHLRVMKNVQRLAESEP